MVPRGLVEVRDRLDRVVWCDPGTPVAEPALAADGARAMRAMLEGVIRHGTGEAAATSFFAASKTGTTNDFKDAWFVGFTDRFVAGVWLGNERGHAMDDVTGGGLPARIWRDVIREATKLPRYRRLPCEQPKGIATARAD